MLQCATQHFVKSIVNLTLTPTWAVTHRKVLEYRGGLRLWQMCSSFDLEKSGLIIVIWSLTDLYFNVQCICSKYSMHSSSDNLPINIFIYIYFLTVIATSSTIKAPSWGIRGNWVFPSYMHQSIVDVIRWSTVCFLLWLLSTETCCSPIKWRLG